MNGNIGMIIQKMRDIAAKCATTNMKLSQVENDIQDEVSGLDKIWAGESKDTFKKRWSKAQAKMDEAKRAIDKIRDLLEQAIEDLLKADKKAASHSQ